MYTELAEKYQPASGSDSSNDSDDSGSSGSSGSSDDKRTTRKKKKIGRKELVVRTKIDSLLKIYNDLGTMKWAGADETWDNAIEAVRKDLFSKIQKSLRKTDRVDHEYPVTIYYKDK